MVEQVLDHAQVSLADGKVERCGAKVDALVHASVLVKERARGGCIDVCTVLHEHLGNLKLALDNGQVQSTLSFVRRGGAGVVGLAHERSPVGSDQVLGDFKR